MSGIVMGRLSVPVSERDHLRGPRDAPVTLLEYGDYECPYCGRAHPITQHVLSLFPDSVRFAFRHFPLTSIHPHAQGAAFAAESAALQDAFWPMHDVLFERQDALAPPDLVEYAEELHLDVGQFQEDFGSQSVRTRVREDFLSGVRSGVNGTPTFFLDGRRLDTGWEPDALIAAIEEALANAPPQREDSRARTPIEP